MRTLYRQFRNGLFRLIATLLSLYLFSPLAQGTSQTETEQTTWTTNRTLVADDGLLYSLPVVDRQQLSSEIHTLSQQLKQRREDLAQIIEQSQFTTKDALIIAALPGGFIYAAVKKQRSHQAQQEMSLVVSQLDSLVEYAPLHGGLTQPRLFAAR
ncbi:hypothetical protein [Sedimenticola sp.]|uniref:hypothetical protein n=1 Tax=Sedimenticola sp. TaxID=1940285 RepID=UPI003D0F9FE1